MADSTIAEFLVALKFKTDEPTWQRFQSTVESATLKAKLFGDAIEAVAKSVAGAVARVTGDFEGLFYASQRLGSSVESIRAFEYAVSQMGGTAAGARASLQNFSDWLRSNKGAEDIIHSMGVATTDAQGRAIDRAKVLLDVGAKLGEMSKQGPNGVGLANKYASLIGGVDQETLLATERPGISGRYDQSLAGDKSAGIGGPMAEAATRFEQAMRETWDRINKFATGAEGKTFASLAAPMEKLNAWLDAHKDDINKSLEKISTAVGDVADKWVKGLGEMKPEDIAKEFDDVATSLASVVTSFGELGKNLKTVSDTLEPLIKLMNSISGADSNGAVFGKEWQEQGGLWGNGSGNGVSGWWKKNAPGWLGGGGSGSDTTPKPTSQHINGAPVSDGNPMPVRLVDAGGGGVLGWLKDALGIGGAEAKGYDGGAGGWGGKITGPGRSPTGGGNPGAGKYNVKAAYDLIKKVGGTDEEARTLAAIAQPESGGNPSNHNPNAATGDDSYGLWQINMLGRMGPERRAKYGLNSNSDLYDPETNARVALRMAREAHGYGDWSTYKNGAYLRYLMSPAALAAGQSSTKAPALGAGAGFGYPALGGTLGANSAPRTGGDRHVSSNITNNITVASNDPDSAASAVGVHLDRTASDLYRNLQGAIA